MSSLPNLFVSLSPALLSQQNLTNSIVVVIDILRASSTIITAMENGAKYVLPVATADECLLKGKKLNAITAGERDGKVIPGLQFGNSPFEYTKTIIKNKILVITTTNGTKLLHIAKQQNAEQIIIGSFLNINAVVNFIKNKNKQVVLACAGWKDKVNIEDALFAGAVTLKLQNCFNMECDSALLAMDFYKNNKNKLHKFLPQISHYKRLAKFGLQKDIEYCFIENTSKCVPFYDGDKLILAK